MPSNKADLLNEVASYYSEKLSEYGETPRGVDWNGEGSQILRFEQLCKIIDTKAEKFSLNDLGCGYGAMLKFLHKNYSNFSYLGIDISTGMIQAANSSKATYNKAHFIIGSEPDSVADYGVASGIFNVRLGRSDKEWLDYLQDTLDSLDRTSRRGFSFNCLTSYSEQEKKRDYLYYADPCLLFDLCMRRYSRQVTLLHGYGLYEFTILVSKIL